MNSENLYIAGFESPVGWIKITGNEEGVSEVIFASEPMEKRDHVPGLIVEAEQQLKEYFDGKRKEFDLKLNPAGTEFQRKVWKELEKIPFGKRVSYLDLAHALGDPLVIRAAGAANGRNPISIIVPCHRVVGSDGSLTGYAGGLWRKRWLLDFELKHSQGEQTKLF